MVVLVVGLVSMVAIAIVVVGGAPIKVHSLHSKFDCDSVLPRLTVVVVKLVAVVGVFDSRGLRQKSLPGKGNET